MPTPKKNIVQPALWHTVFCGVRFAEDGIHLDVEQDFSPPQLSVVLAKATERSSVLARANLDFAAKATVERGGQARSINKVVLGNRGWEVERFVFRPHKIRISRSRVTHFHFYTNAEHWTFDPPGFIPEPNHHTVGTFDTPEVTDFDRTVRVKFTPMGHASFFKYDLRLKTKAWTNGVEDGHAIIIIDPVLETSKL